MPQIYDENFKKKMVQLRLQDGRTYKSITTEYGVTKTTIAKWCAQYSKECQNSPEAIKELNSMDDLLKLKRENESLRKENLFLKKAAAFFAKEID